MGLLPAAAATRLTPFAFLATGPASGDPLRMKGSRRRSGRSAARRYRDLPVLGWREVVSLPDIGVTGLHVKVDTGARSSALHAFRIDEFERDGEVHVRFEVHPLRHANRPAVVVELPVHDRRVIRSSNGRAETRYVVRTRVRIGQRTWPIDVTLARRDQMGYRMLLGREAIRGRFLVHAGRSYIASSASTPESTP